MAGHDDDLSLSPDADTVEGHATALDPAYRLLASQSRFEVRRKLGSGGMGSVFEVYDRERGELVALKTIPRARSAHLIAFKQEFRALADIAHPNLVTLHELLCIDEQWMLSMDRVDGCRFDEYGVDLGQADEGAAEALGPLAYSEAPITVRSHRVVDYARLRAAFGQLVEGLRVIHAAGKVHRDIKPSNVLVGADGRVTILDFGLVWELDHAEELGHPFALAGTPSYMAPELMGGATATPASDWYSAGVLLYRSLTGRPPPADSRAQPSAPPPRPSAAEPSTPPDLDTLCHDLLQPDPEARPTGVEIARRLQPALPSTPRPGYGETTAPGPSPTGDSETPVSATPPAESLSVTGGSSPPERVSEPTSTPRSQAALFGRSAELARVHAAFASSRAPDAGPRCVLLRGASGIGKSVLAAHVRAELHGAGALVLSGRCYENESIPYKALDGIVDALSQRLAGAPAEERALLSPPGFSALVTVFPALDSAATRSPPPAPASLDAATLRVEAFRALRELLRRLSEHRPLVLCIDDLQWGDVDSTSGLAELLSAPAAPRLLLLATYREVSAGHGPVIDLLLDDTRRPPGCAVEVVDIGPLGADDAMRCALLHLGRDHPEADERAAEIAAEAKGHPLFIAQLARHVRDANLPAPDPCEAITAASAARAPISLSDVVESRLERLDEAAERVVEVVSVAGHGLSQGTVLEAAGLDADKLALFRTLRGGALVRARGLQAGDVVESYHDRVRETVLARLPASRRHALHLAIAEALERRQEGTVEQLAEHFFEAEHPGRALGYAERAGDHAFAALAFDRAARFFERATACATVTAHGQLRDLQQKLAQALAYAGRGGAAAELYLEVADRAAPAERTQLMKHAAEHFLQSGQLTRGVTILKALVQEVGLTYPASQRRAFMALIAGMVVLELRRGRFRPRVVPLTRRESLELEICSAAARGLKSFEPAVAAKFMVEYLALALRRGDARHVSKGLSWVGEMVAFDGSDKAAERALSYLDQARRVAEDVGDPGLVALAESRLAIVAMFDCRWHDVVHQIERNGGVFERRAAEFVHERAVGVMAKILAYEHMGQLDAMHGEISAALRAAEETGNVYMRVQGLIYEGLWQVAAGDPARARQRVAEALAQWPTKRTMFQHWLGLKTDVYAALYEGAHGQAHAQLERLWQPLHDARLMKMVLVRIHAHYLRGTVALWRVRQGDARAEREASSSAKLLEREDKLFGRAAAAMLRAGLHAHAGRRAAAIRSLELASAMFRGAEMDGWTAVARARRGALVEGTAGEALVSEAHEALRVAGVSDPARWCEACAPPVSLRRP